MKRLRNHLVGVDQGEVVLFSDFENGGKMWTGAGPRESRGVIRFSESFRTPPNVMATLSMWDAGHDTNNRLDVKAESISVDGFSAVVRTWGDTRIARVRVSWMAIGELRHTDDWDLY